jgi:hypothetical protein
MLILLVLVFSSLDLEEIFDTADVIGHHPFCGTEVSLHDISRCHESLAQLCSQILEFREMFSSPGVRRMNLLKPLCINDGFSQSSFLFPESGQLQVPFRFPNSWNDL